MKTSIVEFQPNTDARKAAEILAGLVGVGAVHSWHYDDMDSVFVIRMSGDIDTKRATPREVIWMGRGVLAFMAHAIDTLEIGATRE